MSTTRRPCASNPVTGGKLSVCPSETPSSPSTYLPNVMHGLNANVHSSFVIRHSSFGSGFILRDIEERRGIDSLVGCCSFRGVDERDRKPEPGPALLVNLRGAAGLRKGRTGPLPRIRQWAEPDTGTGGARKTPDLRTSNGRSP